MSIPTPACTPAARPDPVPRAASPAGAGLWIAIGKGDASRRRPSHTTGHTGPYHGGSAG